jgi:cytochrome c-type biogenesis protein CcmH
MRMVSLLVLGALAAAGQDTTAETRTRALEEVLLAPCCFAEPVARHQSEAAARMKIEIARFVKQGKSDRDIIEYYKQRYGDKIYAPLVPERWWVRAVPWAALLAGLALVVWLLRKMTAHSGGAKPATV